MALLNAFSSRRERARRVVELPDGTAVEKPRLAANTRRMVRAIVGGVMQQAALHQAVAARPVRDLEGIQSTKGHKEASSQVRSQPTLGSPLVRMCPPGVRRPCGSAAEW